MVEVEFYGSDGTLDRKTAVASLEELMEVAGNRKVRLVGGGALDHGDAMRVIDAYRRNNGLPGTLETLEQMKAQRHLLTHREKHAFDVIFAGFRQMFFGDEA